MTLLTESLVPGDMHGMHPAQSYGHFMRMRLLVCYTDGQTEAPELELLPLHPHLLGKGQSYFITSKNSWLFQNNTLNF
jgi:hypothetical protein